MINKALIEDFFSKEMKFEGVERELEIAKQNYIYSWS